jgi:hypothetical protein
MRLSGRASTIGDAMSVHEAAQREAERRAVALHALGWESGAGAAIWARAVEDALELHESARARQADRSADRAAWERLHASGFALILAVDQVREFARQVLMLTNDAELEEALRTFDADCPRLRLLRDLLAHLPAYAVGEGHRQTPDRAKWAPRITERNVMSFVSWSGEGGTLVDLAGDELDLRRTAAAARELAPVVERVRTAHLEKAEIEANEALRRKHAEWLQELGGEG